MVGTATDSIIVRGEHEVAGYWAHIDIESNSMLNEIAYVNFKHAGVSTSDQQGAILLHRDDALKIHDVVFTDCVKYGMTIHTNSSYILEYSNLTLDNTEFLFSD